MGIGVGGFRRTYCDVVSVSGVPYRVCSSSAHYGTMVYPRVATRLQC
jgi:hypothetical protein